MENEYMEFFRNEHEIGKKGDYDMTEGDFYNDFKIIEQFDGITGIKKEQFYDLGKKLNTLPDEYNSHNHIKKLYQKRL